MNTTEVKALLDEFPEHALAFILPDGERIPTHAHVTEVARIDKNFIDCGGSVRTSSNCTLQAWVADDLHHRLTPAKLSMILGMAEPLFRGDVLDVEVEYEGCSISQFSVLGAQTRNNELAFILGEKHTDCLAKELCLVDGTCGEKAGCCA